MRIGTYAKVTGESGLRHSGVLSSDRRSRPEILRCRDLSTGSVVTSVQLANPKPDTCRIFVADSSFSSFFPFFFFFLTVKFDLTAPAQARNRPQPTRQPLAMRPLIARIPRGEPSSFTNWCGRTRRVCTSPPSPSCRMSGRRRRGPGNHAEGLKNLHNFALSRISTWLISSAVNEARARMRHARVLKFESVDQPAEDEEADFTPAVLTDWREVPLQALERKELREHCSGAIASCRKFIVRCCASRVEEVQYRETAGRIGRERGGVKTRLLRARLMMQKIWRRNCNRRRAACLDLFRSKAGGSWF